MAGSALIPEFRLFTEDNPAAIEAVMPKLSLRKWSDLWPQERERAFQEFTNLGWADHHREILASVEFLNRKFLRLAPGKRLHAIKPRGSENDYDRLKAASGDFHELFVSAHDVIALAMLSAFAKATINYNLLAVAAKLDETEQEKINETVHNAYSQFDRLAACLNRIFESFAIDQMVTRTGFVPRQEPAVAERVYKPTLVALSAPRWAPINTMLADMFSDFSAGRYADVITKAHNAVHRFLQIVTGEGANGKGELGKLFGEARRRGLIGAGPIGDGFVTLFQKYISSERAAKSTAKPASSEATSNDALLAMDLTLVFLQHALKAPPT